MANFESGIKTILDANAALVAQATGGIYKLESLGKLGLNRTLHTGAFTNGIIKPSIVIRQRSDTPTYDYVDEGHQVMSCRAVVELWFYQASGYTTIRSMREKCFPLLHDKKVNNGRCMYIWEVLLERDVNLDASVERTDYEVIYLRHAS